MIRDIVHLLKFKDLILTWTGRIIRSRYQQTILGGLWIVVQPIASVAIFNVIFTMVVPIDTGATPYIIFSFAAMVPWLLLSGSLPDMSNSLISNMQLITKIYFPREILGISALLARLVDFLVSYMILIGLLLFFHVPIFQWSWLYLPLILVIQIVLILGLGLGLAALNVFYRDVMQLMGLGIQIWFYASPIIYPVSMVPDRIKQFYFLNPMAGVLEAYRAVLLNGDAPGSYLWISSVVALLIFIFGYRFFKRVEFQFADII